MPQTTKCNRNDKTRLGLKFKKVNLWTKHLMRYDQIVDGAKQLNIKTKIFDDNCFFGI